MIRLLFFWFRNKKNLFLNKLLVFQYKYIYFFISFFKVFDFNKIFIINNYIRVSNTFPFL
jgi:hypothetical protein